MKEKLSQVGKWALLLTSCLTIMVGTVIAPALLEIAEHLHFSDHPEWLITLPSLGVVLFAPVVGRLIDFKGTYKVMCWGLVPYGLLGVSGMFLTNYYLIIVDRLLLGGATAALAAAGTGLIAEYFEGALRMKMIAWQGMAIEFGGVVFLSLGGILGQVHWQLPFLIYSFAFICLIMIVVGLPKPVATIPPVIPKDKSVFSNRVTGIVLFALFSMLLFFVAFGYFGVMVPVISVKPCHLKDHTII